MLSKTVATQVAPAIQQEKAINLTPMMKAITKWVQVDPGDRILDMSCGNGEVLQYFSKRMECQISAVTSSVEQFRQVRGNIGNVNVMYAQPEDIPWRDNSFDVVMCNTRMVKMIHPDKILKEVLRVLRPGGQFVLVAPCYPSIVRNVFKGKEKEKNQLNRSYFTNHEMIVTLENLGFTNISFQKERGWIGVATGWKESLLEK